MDSVELSQNGNSIMDMYDEQLLSLNSSDTCDIFSDQEVFPRVGDEYQAVIPPLISESDYLSYTRNPMDAENGVEFPLDFFMGLPVPISWINKEVESLKHKRPEFIGDLNDAYKNALIETERVKEIEACLKDDDKQLKVEPLDVTMACGFGVKESANLAREDKLHRYRGQAYCFVPGCIGDSWSDIEKSSFLLGLYTFGKNFVRVERFIGSKKMGNILSFYYGEFYRSKGYRRWSRCRKMRSRRFVYGQKIFTGMRQQELLSRLLPHASNECQIALLEVSKTFGDGKMSLEEYVSSLKAMIGITILVEAVGIGKGKLDLTTMALEPSKSSQVIPMRPDIPSGKACSSLTTTEIVEFLTGDYRLSKARSNDLFWEAVWPRLLARGWHSEQPKKQGYAASSNHSLVFLMPGVKKFSRRRLVKGNHYFDSISDVLRKVASEPGLIELDTADDEGNKSKEEYGWNSGVKLEQDELPDQRRHCYLQPPTPSRNTDVMKFTVVDTSLVDGKPFKVRELRTLPFEISNKLISRSHSEDGSDNGSVVSTDESDIADATLLHQEESNNAISERGIFSKKKDLKIAALKQDILINGADSINVPVNNSKNHYNLCEDKQPRKRVKCNSRERPKPDNLDSISPVTKRSRNLTACGYADTNQGMTSFFEVPKGEEVVHNCCSDALDLTENYLFRWHSTQDKLSSSGSSKDSPIESIEGTISERYHGLEHPVNIPEPRTLIDLNLPEVPPDFETDVFFMTETIEGRDDHTRSEPDNVRAPENLKGSSEQQPNMNSRRQSTRNRPPTTRALEALANGFLTINKRRKNKESSPRENLTSRPSRRARDVIGLTGFSTSTVASKIGGGGDGGCNVGSSNMFNNFQILSEGNGTRVSGL